MGKKISVPDQQPWQPSLSQPATQKQIQLPSSDWQPLPGILAPIAQKMFKGENRLDRFAIDDTYATETKNLTSSEYPALSVRPGYTRLGAAFAARILGLDAWKESEIHAISNGNWYSWNGSAWSASLASGLSTTANWSFCNFKGAYADFNLIGSNGVVVKKYDGAAVSDLGNAPAGGNFIDTHDNRLYCAVKNLVYFSALNIADDWSDTDPYVGSGAIKINDDSGKDIVGLKAGSEHLLTFFPHSSYELFGTGPDDMRMMPVAQDIGLLSNQCVVSVGGVLYWADANRIYRYTGGSRPQFDFSLPVQWYLDTMNAANRAKCCAGTNGKKFYFSLPSGTATDPDTTLEYDPQFGIWNVWKDIAPLYWAMSGNVLYFGDKDGGVNQVGGTTDSGTAIAWKWVSVPFGSRIAAQDIRWYRMWIIADIPVGSTCNVYLSALDEGDTDWTLASSVTADAGMQKKRIIVPVDTIANAGWIRVKFEGTGPVHIHEFDRQQRELPII